MLRCGLKEKTFGNTGAKVLIIHGWMHSSNLYETLAVDLSNHFCVTLIDLPGFGSLSNFDFGKKVTINSLADWLSDYILNNKFDMIFAHSLGGTIILRLVEKYGDQVGQKIILCNPAYHGIDFLKPFVVNKALVKYLLAIQMILPDSISKFVIKLAALLTVNKYRRINDIIVNDARACNIDIASTLLREICFDSWRFTNFSEYTKRILLLISQKDRIISLAKMKMLRNDLDCRIISLPNIGHTPVVEDYESLLTIIYKEVEF
jgi:pimeloyl-ACP methyl ester carboxylesterase